MSGTPGRRLADDAGTQGESDHLGSVARTQLAGDPGQVALHGERRQVQLDADVAVGVMFKVMVFYVKEGGEPVIWTILMILFIILIKKPDF